MAMKTASPWWFSALFAAGLVLVFLGERPLHNLDAAHLVFTGLGTLLLVAVTGLRLWTFSATTGSRRAVERTLLMSQVGTLFALGLYSLTTAWGQGFLGVDSLDAKGVERFVIPMTVLWSILMAVSVVPMLMVELSLGTARRTEFSPADMAKSDVDEEAVESFRVREMATSGLTIALAAAFLMVTCNVAKQRNVRDDVSYFKTSSPGSSTVKIVKSVSEPVKVHLFFPPVSEVKNEIRGYFDALKARSGNMEIEEHDRMLSAALAKEFKVGKDGTVVIVFADKSENLEFTVDPEKIKSRSARTELRELDSKVNTAMMKVVRTRRTVYLTVGHGELNDPESSWAKVGMGVTQLKQRLREMNYQVKELGVTQGLTNEVPDDAELVIVLGPKESLLDEELGALDRYLARGGRLLIALDPVQDAGLGVLEGRLGLRFNKGAVTDDKQFMAQTRTPRDYRLIVTNRFSSHAATSTLSRAASRYGMIFINAGSLDEVDFAADKPKAKRTHIIRSMVSSFIDANGNFKFDEGSEKREQYNLATAVEDPTSVPVPKEGEEAAAHEGMRAVVFADVDVFEDNVMRQLGGAQAMFDDAVKWLGGEENIAGEIVSEKDVIIEHTRNEDVLLFYSTIVGAPLLVFGFGLWFGWWRRQRSQRRSS